MDLDGLDDAKLTALQWRITLVAAMGQFLDGYALLIIGASLLLIIPLFKPTPTALSFMVAATFIGSFIGALIAGWLGDKLGRRSILLWVLFFFVIASIGAGFSQNMGQLTFWRFLIGVGVGADLPVGYAMIAEIAPKRERGRLLATPLAVWGLGGITAAIVGFLFVTYGGPYGWRWMFWLAVIPAVAVLLLRRSLPETPRWLAVAGRGVDRQGRDSRGAKGQRGGFAELFQLAYLGRTVMAFLLNTVNSVTGVTFTIFTPLMVSLLGITSKGGSVAFGGVIYLAFSVGALINMALADRVGRVALMIWAVVGQLVGLTVLWLTDAHVPVLIFILFPVVFALNLTAATSIWDFGVECFPTRIRASGEGVVFSGSRLGGVVAALTVPYIIAGPGVRYVMLEGMIGMVVVLGLALMRVMPEARGRSLEDVGESHVAVAATKGPI
ncbi:MAG: MFS transporter [Candidatus Dormibacteria bacterium]